jgi:outer membrane protein assembly factor BamB
MIDNKPRFVHYSRPSRRIAMAFVAITCLPATVVNAVGASPTKPTVRVHAKPSALSAGAITANWPRFLGPNHNNTTPETKLLKKFPEKGPTLLWEMDRGEGYAAPSIVKGKLVFFHKEGDLATVNCLHPETGEHYWRFTYPSEYKDRYDFSPGPRCSPVIDGDRVYTFGVEGMLHCLRLSDGSLVWKRDINGEYKVPQDFFGTASTPLVQGDVVIVNVGAPGGPTVVAFDKYTGKVKWTVGDQWGPSCASPVPATINGQQRILVFAGGDSDPPTGGLLSIDPVTAKIDVRFPFRSKRYISINAASPLAIGDQVFLTTSYRTGGALVNVGAKDKGDVAWKSKSLGSHFATPIYRDGVIFGLSGAGSGNTEIVAVDAKTGEQLWRHMPSWKETVERNGKPQEMTFSIGLGSLVLADGHFLALSEMGHLAWFDLTRTGHREMTITTPFFATQSWTPPVISRGLLYLCQNNKDTGRKTTPRLLCYDLRSR